MVEMVAGFTLSRPLGRGGMGQVFEARRADFAQPVAVKLLPPGAEPRTMQRLLREGELLTRLEHPNVIRVHEVGVSQGHPYVAMELLAGVPLTSLIAQLSATASRPSLAVVAELARGMARGLHAAHEAGVLHRDIKPSNIVITAQGRVVVLDFGIALEGDVSRLTADGEVAGTPAYLAPEQALGDALDARADVYQFGLILHELCTLKRPYAELKAFDALTRRLRDGVPSLRQTAPLVEPRLAALTDACLHKDKDKRLASFAAVLAKLEGLPAGTAELAAAVAKLVPKSVPEPLQPPASSPQPPGPVTQIGPWSVVGRLGAGGMGVVFKARTSDGTECALKLMHPNMLARDDVVRRFEREIRLATSLQHPGLVRILDADVSGEFPWYAMELVQGESLAERLQRDRKLDVIEATRILTAMISALAALHRAGLVHRDIKPGNVMLEASGRVLLMDLGLVGGEELTKLTRTGAVIGTPIYLPPEALDGEFAMPGDLYQIGLVLHEMLTGDARVRIEAGVVPPEVAASRMLAEIYRAVLHSDPARRPRDAVALEAMITQPAPPPARKPAPPPKLPVRQVEKPTAPPPTQTDLSVLRRGGELAVGFVKYGLVAITIAISLGILAVLPSILRRFGS